MKVLMEKKNIRVCHCIIKAPLRKHKEEQIPQYKKHGAREMAHEVKYLSQKHEDLDLIPSIHIKAGHGVEEA